MSCKRDDADVCPKCGLPLLFPFSDGEECHGRCPKHGIVYWLAESADDASAQKEGPQQLRTVGEMAAALKAHVGSAAWVRESRKVTRAPRKVRI